MPRRAWRASGSVPTAIISRKPRKIGRESEGRRRRPRLARADRQQDFLAERIFEFFELQRRFALVAEHFEHGRTILFGHLDTAVFQVDHVHLQRFHLKVAVVAAVWASQRHVMTPSVFDSMGWLGATQCKYGRNLVDFGADGLRFL